MKPILRKCFVVSVTVSETMRSKRRERARIVAYLYVSYLVCSLDYHESLASEASGNGLYDCGLIPSREEICCVGAETNFEFLTLITV